MTGSDMAASGANGPDTSSAGAGRGRQPLDGVLAESIEEREARLRAVFEAIDEAYCLCEMVVENGVAVDYRFLEVNHLFEAMTGLADPVGRTALGLVPGLEQHWIDTYSRVALGRETLRFEQGSDVMGRWFDVFAVPVDPPGRFVLVFRDVTSRRATQLALVESEQQFREMTDDLPVFVWMHDERDHFVWTNRTVCDFCGVGRSDIVDGGVRFVSHPEEPVDIVARMREARRTRTPLHGHTRLRRADGEWRWIEVWGRPRYDSAGSYLGYLGAALDVTEPIAAQAATERSALFMRQVLDNLFAFVGVLTPDGVLTEANRAPLEAAGITLDDVIGVPFWETRWWSVDDDTQERVRNAVDEARQGRVVRYDTRIRGRDDELIWIDFQLAPMFDDDGKVTHLVPSAHVISERVETERRLASALDAERRVRQRVEVLQRNATELSGAITIDDIAERLLAELRRSFGLDLSALNVVRDDHLEVIAPSHMPAAAVDRYQHVPLDADLPGPVAIRTNQPVLLGSHDEISARFPDITGASIGLPRLETLLTIPVRGASGRPIGALFLASPQRGWLDAATLEVITSMADQAGLALERAQLHQQVLEAHAAEHAIALQLQRALLPDRVVQQPGLDIAARYVAASDLMAIGGDWYDTFTWPDGGVAITVGDVVGHDVGAATTMGRLRIGVNALMSRCRPRPDAVLAAYGDYGHDLGPAFATAVAVVVDPSSGTLRYANAGHPAPLVVLPDGEIRWLSTAVAPPLGVPVERGYVATELTLPPGATIVMYSDGLIERRREHLDLGFERLAASASRHAGASPDELADLILGDLTDSVEIADDVIVVCARWTPGA
jgi:PAS domain S-box-containing protein